MKSKMCGCGKAQRLPRQAYCAKCAKDYRDKANGKTTICVVCHVEQNDSSFEIIDRKGRHWIRSEVCLTCSDKIRELKNKQDVILSCDNKGRVIDLAPAVPVDKCKCGADLFNVPENLRGLGLFSCDKCLGYTKAPISYAVEKETKNTGMRIA
jgi:hypothetical protein